MIKQKSQKVTQYLVKIAYDGSDFFGWASQNQQLTVEKTINQLLSNIFKLKIKISGSSRTDAKVHAKAQLFTFKLPFCLPIKIIKQILNQNFPQAISLKTIKKVSWEFDLRTAIKSKEYLYLINVSNKPNVFAHKYQWQYQNKINLEELSQTLNLFVGYHYFWAFSGLKIDDNKSFYRIISNIKVVKNNNLIKIYIEGNGFLRYQIRYLVGAAVAVCEDKITTKQIISYLQPKSKIHYPYAKASAAGLYLNKTNLKTNN